MLTTTNSPLDQMRFDDAGDGGGGSTARRKTTVPVTMGSPSGSMTTYGTPTRTAVPTGTRLATPTTTSTPTSQPSWGSKLLQGMQNLVGMTNKTAGLAPPAGGGTMVGTAGPSVAPRFQTSPTPPAPQAPQAAAPLPPGATALTGRETPYAVNPNRSQGLQGVLEALRNRAMGGGPLGGMLQSEAMRQLRNPSVYDDELMTQAIDQGKRRLDREFSGLREGLSSELGGRGLEYSSHASGRFGDLAAQQGYAMQDLMNNILRERAASIGSSRAAAFNNALGLEGQGFQQGSSVANLLGAMERGERDEQRGERGYVDHLRRQGRQDAMDEALLGEDLRRSREGEAADWMRMAMADNPGTSDLWGGADAYGQDAARQYALLSQLMATYGANA